MPAAEQLPRADVCLVLEATWPYVAGGVSTWVQQLLELLPHYNFWVVHLAARPEDPRIPKYRIPANVVGQQDLFLFGAWPKTATCRLGLADSVVAALQRVMSALSAGNPLALEDLDTLLTGLPPGRQGLAALLASEEWYTLVCADLDSSPEPRPSVLDHFWAWRFMLAPLLACLQSRLPPARCYHSACTGYAGVMAALAARQRQVPFLLTEHGLYARERRIEISNAQWLSGGDVESGVLPAPSPLRRRWTRFFESLAVTAYRQADRITTLFEDNRRDQILAGAPAERCLVIPNGIEYQTLTAAPRPPRPTDGHLRIGFVGRITAIKDLHTLLGAVALLVGRGVPCTCDLLGPLDEEPEYAERCRETVAALGLGAVVEFRGRVNVQSWYPRLDVLLLTSVSEGQPFVILEAFAARIPVVATDVGACREMVQGATGDRLGHAGIICPVGDCTAIADALERLHRDPSLAETMGRTGLARLRASYDLRRVMGRYKALYDLLTRQGRDGLRRGGRRRMAAECFSEGA